MKTSKENLKAILSEIVLTSSIHGIPGILRTKRTFFKFVWAISFIVSASACAFMLIKSINEYFKYEIVTTSTVKTEMPAKFPEITICNSNPLLTNDALEYVNEVFDEWNLKNKEIWDVFYDDKDDMDFSSMNIYMSKLIILAKAQNKNLTDEFRKGLGLSIDKMLISCVFSLTNCLPSHFEWYFDSLHGNCFIFKGNPDLKVTKEGMLNGLRLEIFVGEPLSIRNFAFGNGLTLFINNETLLPSPFDGYEISTGKETNIHLEKLRIRKVYEPYGECTLNLDTENSYDSDLYRTTFKNFEYYRQQDCLNGCFQEALVKTLGCYTTLFPYNSSLIQPCLKQYEIKYVFALFRDFFSKKSLIDDCLIGCPLECESETYTFTVSSLDYPTKVFADYIGKKSAFLSRYGNRTPSYDELKGSLVKLNINFQSLQYTLVEESQKTTWIDLISNTGGTLGLFTGFSFLSLVELLEIIFEICRVKSSNLFNFKNKVGKNNKYFK
jgi:hypothetical protein